jgi:class 3 adenylate cyclase
MVERRSQPAALRDQLVRAQGRSEFVVVVFVDVRGFSRFSKVTESPDSAMFIKRFYSKLLEEYFPEACFCRPTGDGLMMIFRYDEESLPSVSQAVLASCVRCLSDFSMMFTSDPMINFEVPQNIGFGIARGTACCLHAGEESIDYSGHLLNLAQALLDLARPSGIVVDGGFRIEMFPEKLRRDFECQLVYIPAVAESEPVEVFVQKDFVRLPAKAHKPINEKPWKTHHSVVNIAQLGAIGDTYAVVLPSQVDAGEEINVTMVTPAMRNGREIKGFSVEHTFASFDLSNKPRRALVSLDLKKATALLEGNNVPIDCDVSFRIQYVASR